MTKVETKRHIGNRSTRLHYWPVNTYNSTSITQLVSPVSNRKPSLPRVSILEGPGPEAYEDPEYRAFAPSELQVELPDVEPKPVNLKLRRPSRAP